MIQVGDYDITKYFNTEEPAPPKSPHEQAKVRADRLETESYYLEVSAWDLRYGEDSVFLSHTFCLINHH